jgi:hypothetical protein
MRALEILIVFSWESDQDIRAKGSHRRFVSKHAQNPFVVLCSYLSAHRTQQAIATALKREMKVRAHKGAGCDMIQEVIGQKPRVERTQPDLFQPLNILQVLDKLEQRLLWFQVLAVETEMNASQYHFSKTLSRIVVHLFDNFLPGETLAEASHAWHYAKAASIVTPVLDLHQRSGSIGGHSTIKPRHRIRKKPLT